MARPRQERGDDGHEDGPSPAADLPPTPHADGLRMPAEWAPHERCLIAWPARESLWGDQFEAAKAEYAGVVEAVARFEPVLLVANVGQGSETRGRCGSDNLEVVEMPIDDSWLRDCGPVFVTGVGGRAGGVDFLFNSWGEKYLPYDKDAAVTALLLERLGVPRYAAPFVLEGGAICVDGEGTLLTTESCLLNPSRNPGMTREQVETGLRDYLGVEKVIWLEGGYAGDRDTDGHVDGVALFVRPGVVLVQTVSDTTSPDHARSQENLRRLRAATDARDRTLEIIELDVWAETDVGGSPIEMMYVNLYVANGGVIVPLSGQETPDRTALEIIGDTFHGREVVGVPGNVLGFGGGGPHCITQQQPLAL